MHISAFMMWNRSCWCLQRGTYFLREHRRGMGFTSSGQPHRWVLELDPKATHWPQGPGIKAFKAAGLWDNTPNPSTPHDPFSHGGPPDRDPNTQTSAGCCREKQQATGKLLIRRFPLSPPPVPDFQSSTLGNSHFCTKKGETATILRASFFSHSVWYVVKGTRCEITTCCSRHFVICKPLAGVWGWPWSPPVALEKEKHQVGAGTWSPCR